MTYLTAGACAALIGERVQGFRVALDQPENEKREN